MGSVSLIPLRGSENEMRRSVAAFTADPLSVSGSGPCGPCGAWGAWGGRRPGWVPAFTSPTSLRAPLVPPWVSGAPSVWPWEPQLLTFLHLLCY